MATATVANEYCNLSLQELRESQTIPGSTSRKMHCES